MRKEREPWLQAEDHLRRAEELAIRDSIDDAKVEDEKLRVKDAWYDVRDKLPPMTEEEEKAAWRKFRNNGGRVD